LRERLVLLGTKGGPAIRPGGAMPTSSLLEIGGRVVVIDCGLGVTRGITDAGISLKALDLVFITHLHSDHVLELGPLLHTAWTAGLSSVVRVFGPVGTKAHLDGFCASMRFDIDTRVDDEGRPDLRRLIDVTEFGERSILDGDLTVAALRVDHPPVTECFALRFDHAGRGVVFSADTAYFPPLADFARDADVLVHEAMLAEGVERLVARTGNGSRLREHLYASHTLAEDAARIAAAANVGHLVLHHLIPADDLAIREEDWVAAVRGNWNGALTIGCDGLVLPLTALRETRSLGGSA
jgi:ribonuclease BN (tRNA processing enzyme)